jgi:hypothetical protein
VSTNGIGLLELGEFVGDAYPDETRDSGVRYAWVGDYLFADTGAFFLIEEEDRKCDFEPLKVPHFMKLEWNAAIGAVVGSVVRGRGEQSEASGAEIREVERGLYAFNPRTQQRIYYQDLSHLGNAFESHWSRDGRWCAWVRKSAGAGDEILIFDGDNGRLLHSFRPAARRVNEVHFHREGSLLVASGESGRRSSHVEIVRGGRIETRIALSPRAMQPGYELPEGGGAAWSPSGDRVALLLDGQEVQIHDARSGAVLTRFRAPAPPVQAGPRGHDANPHRLAQDESPGDLLWPTPDCLVRLAPHFVAFWGTSGARRAELIAPGT